MDKNTDQNNLKLVRSGSLVVDLSSMRNGFHKEEDRNHKETWDYIQYRESLVRWPAMNEQIKGGAL